MGKYIRMTKTYLVILTIFILLRFTLELIGPEQYPTFYGGLDSTYITSEISATRLLFVLPVFLGIRFADGTLGGWKEMLIANFVYVLWGVGLIDLLHVIDGTLGLGTHYGRGFNMIHFMGHIYDLKGWIPRSPSAGYSFCESILLMTILTNIICFVTIRLNRQAEAVQEIQVTEE